ncbi:MAG: DivIVA domain-containing protein [Eubacteriales bacterium]
MTFDTDTINNIKFNQVFRGYDTAEVDEFLDDMIRSIEKLNNTIKNLKEDVAKEKRKNQLNQQEIDRLNEINESLSATAAAAVQEPAKIVEVQAPRIEPEVKAEAKKPMSIDDIKGTPEYEEMKQMLTDTLLNAQHHAEKLVKDAQERANTVIEESERKAQDRIVSLNAEINENQNRLEAIKNMVRDAKQRFIKNFKDQITALDSIDVADAAEVDLSEMAENIAPEPQIKFETSEEVIFSAELPPLDDFVDDYETQEEEPAPVAEDEKEEPVPVEEKAKPSELPGINTFDFAAVKKSLQKETTPLEAELEIKETVAPFEEMPPETPIAPPEKAETSSNEEDENQQYIELALSAYNDNKHHNSDYPNTSAGNLKINEDDDDGGIYQPENRSVLSSVIEEILNNKKND